MADDEAAVRVLCGDARDVLATLEPASVHACITSPPYFALRSYQGGAQEIGTEQTPQEYVAALVDVFRAVRRVLRDEGTLWLVLGDSYNSGTQFNHHKNGLHHADRYHESPDGKAWGGHRALCAAVPAKNLLGIPWRVAFALQDDGWLLRQEVIWHKPNPMPESVKDRCTRAHETVFMLAKQPRYYYDQQAIAEPTADTNAQRTTTRYNTADRYGAGNGGNGGLDALAARMRGGIHTLRNKRSVWSISTTPFSARSLGVKDIDHYAAFPPELVRPMVRAATSERGVCAQCGAPWRRAVERSRTGRSLLNAPHAQHDATLPHSLKRDPTRRLGPGVADLSATRGWQPTCRCDAGEPLPAIVLDPFCGSGTTGLVAVQEGRRFIGVDLNPAYVALAQRRIATAQPPLLAAI